MKNIKSLMDDIDCIMMLDPNKNINVNKEKISAIQFRSIGNLFSIVKTEKGQNALINIMLSFTKAFNPDKTIETPADVSYHKKFLVALKSFEIAMTAFYKNKNIEKTEQTVCKVIKDYNLPLSKEVVDEMFEKANAIYKFDGKKKSTEMTK